MEPIEKPEKEIIQWSDGKDAWSMIIEPGRVEFRTTAEVPDQALKAHSEAWTEAFRFIQGRFTPPGDRK